jgi:hypothetical protein
MNTPYKDGLGQPLDIGDYVKFIGDGPTGTVFQIIRFTLDAEKALIYASPSRKYWTTLETLRWIR